MINIFKVNTNEKTGIPCGVIAANDIDSDQVYSMIQNDGKSLDYNAAVVEMANQNGYQDYIDHCDETGQELLDHEDYLVVFHPDEIDSLYIEEENFAGMTDGIQWNTFHLGGVMHFMVCESPFVQEYRACSPCVPNAHNIDTDAPVFELQDAPNGSSLGYSIPANWFLIRNI